MGYLNVDRKESLKKEFLRIYASRSLSVFWGGCIAAFGGALAVAPPLERLKKLLNDKSITDINKIFGAVPDQVFHHEKFGLLLNKLIIDKKLNNGDVIKVSGMDKGYFYQILRGEKLQPSRDRVIQLGFGIRLGVKELNELLSKACYHCLREDDRRDALIIFCLVRGLSIFETDELLGDFGLGYILPDSIKEQRRNN